MNLMVNNKKRSISMIPYLTSNDTGITIKFSSDQEDDPMCQPSPFLFQIISESNPFSKIIQAEVISDTSGQPEPVFLLTQKDIYTLPGDNESLNNNDVEKSWQQAFLYYSHNRLSNPPLMIEEQVSANGELIPFQSLWYCRYKDLFFNPLCPDCGAPLDQCYDDDLLTQHGLKPFSKSIQRYLYCPHCIESTAENAVFYVPELDPTIEKDASGVLKGPEDLIIGMGNIKAKEFPGSDYPCAACDNHPACYGEEKMAVLRIAVFSFFPFCMMIFKTSAANAVDLFSMISQPVVSEIENQEKAIPEADGHLPEVDGHLKDKASLESSVAKKAIQSILKNILQTWQKEVAAFPEQYQQSRAVLTEKENDDRTRVSGRELGEEGDLDRTVIISSRKDITRRMAAFAQKQDLEKTVVISKKDKTAPAKNAGDRVIKRQMEKTVIITADTMDKYSSSFVGHEQNNGQANNDQAMEKTVIINSKVNGAGDKTEIIRKNRHARQNRCNNDDLDKTVIISPGKNSAETKDALGNSSSGSDRTIFFADDMEDAGDLTKKPAPEKIPTDDVLEKTVIINPKKK